TDGRNAGRVPLRNDMRRCSNTLEAIEDRTILFDCEPAFPGGIREKTVSHLRLHMRQHEASVFGGMLVDLRMASHRKDGA
ncbi:hypothetical protein SB768_31725, partial [Burkholderia sp. SIMBA_043]|uniref:hypothetical protein n=1 Tax=Burkholderia sp. SIMBA_043 TaxID=3085784 RepID=UPI00397DB99F